MCQTQKTIYYSPRFIICSCKRASLKFPPNKSLTKASSAALLSKAKCSLRLHGWIQECFTSSLAHAHRPRHEKEVTAETIPTNSAVTNKPPEPGRATGAGPGSAHATERAENRAFPPTDRDPNKQHRGHNQRERAEWGEKV